MGIVGFGRFGRFASIHLREHFDLTVFDNEARLDEARRLGFQAGRLEEVSRCSILLLSVPISKIGSVLREIAPYLSRPCLVVDTCSVKEFPVSQMETYLPSHVEILGAHPLFGPDSAAEGLLGKKIALCPVRTKSLMAVKRFLEKLGLKVIVCSPEAHDRAMASTQAIVQFIGRAFLEMGLGKQFLATPGYETLTSILEVVQNDTWELFFDLQNFDRFAGQMREKLIESLIRVNQKLQGQDVNISQETGKPSLSVGGSPTLRTRPSVRDQEEGR